MSYAFRVPDEAYRALRLVAERQGRTPEDLFEEWVCAQSESMDASPVGCVRTQNQWWSRAGWSGILLLL